MHNIKLDDEAKILPHLLLYFILYIHILFYYNLLKHSEIQYEHRLTNILKAHRLKITLFIHHQHFTITLVTNFLLIPLHMYFGCCVLHLSLLYSIFLIFTSQSYLLLPLFSDAVVCQCMVLCAMDG